MILSPVASRDGSVEAPAHEVVGRSCDQTKSKEASRRWRRPEVCSESLERQVETCVPVVEHVGPQSLGGDDLLGVLGDPVAENVALQSHLLKESQNTVSTPTLREQELCQSAERCEKMRLRDAHPATVRTPDRGVVLVAGE